MTKKDKIKKVLKDKELEDRLEFIECRLNEIEGAMSLPEGEDDIAVMIPTELYEEFVKYTNQDIDFVGIT